MIRQMFIKSVAATVVAVGLLSASAMANTVSMQFIFYDGWNNGYARALAPSEVAGLPDTAAANYNLVYTTGTGTGTGSIPTYTDGGTHTLVTGDYNQYGGFNAKPAFVDDSGAATTLGVSATGFTRMGAIASPVVGAPNQDLMSHAWSVNPRQFNSLPVETCTLTISNLNANGFANYELVVYLALDTGDGNNHPATFILDGGTPIAITVDGDSAKGNPVPFVDASTGVGNYLRFTGLTGDSVALSVTSAPYFNNIGFAGLQIIEIPEPATLSLLAVGGLLIARRRKA